MAESESIERWALEDLHRAAPPELAERLGLTCSKAGGACISVAARLPGSAIVINRSLGLGLSGPEPPGTVDTVIDTYEAAGISRYFVQLHPDAQPAELGTWCRAKGLEPARAWQKFERGNDPIEVRDTALEVREVGPEYGEAFGKIVCAGFDLGEEAVPWLACLAGREQWHIFMSFERGAPAGVGALFVQDDLGWLDWAATAPELRRRGSQSAVLGARLRLAASLQVRRIFTCTGVDVPGDPQHSYKNIRRAGFRETYVRENLAPVQNSP